MTSRHSALAAATVLCAALASACTQTTHPNVILIVVDTLRADHLGCYGYPRPTSPHLDAFAARGVRFTQAHATSSWTAPSVASILTGLAPAVHGVEKSTSILSNTVPTMAESFRAAGYTTAAIASNPVFVCSRIGFARGFDSFNDLHGPPVAVDKPVKMIPIDTGFGHFVEVATADLVTDAALAWLKEQRGRGKPYFLFLHYVDPHADYFPPQDFAARFGVPADAALAGVAQRPVLRSFKVPASPDDLATLVNLYDAEIAFADLHIGRLLDTAGWHDGHTLVVLTADHGEEFGDHGRLSHGITLFEEQLRIPLIVAGAGLPSGSFVDTPVSLASLWATLAELSGTGAAPTGTGPSFAALTRGGQIPASTLFADLENASPGMPHFHRHAVLDAPWKLITRTDGSALLFDLASDPQEQQERQSTDAAHAQPLRDQLAARDAATTVARATAAPVSAELSAEVRARMRALGYGD